jgi:hypothetical protein
MAGGGFGCLPRERLITMKAVPFIDLTVADSELEGVTTVGDVIWVNAHFIRNHCQQIQTHRGTTGCTTSLIFPGGIAGIHVKDSYDEIEAKMQEALGDATE